MATVARVIRMFGDGKTVVHPYAAQCRYCTTLPEPYWIVAGHAVSGKSVSFGHDDSRAAADATLARAMAENPDLTYWEIERCTPSTQVRLVHSIGTEPADPR